MRSNCKIFHDIGIFSVPLQLFLWLFTKFTRKPFLFLIIKYFEKIRKRFMQPFILFSFVSGRNTTNFCNLVGYSSGQNFPIFWLRSKSDSWQQIEEWTEISKLNKVINSEKHSNDTEDRKINWRNFNRVYFETQMYITVAKKRR